MKSLKIYSLLLLSSLIAVGCSDDDEFNTISSSVEFGTSELRVKENANMIFVPVQVSDSINGPVHVTISAEAYGSSQAEEDVHYMITDKNIIISPESKTANVEVLILENDEINENRTFKLTIASSDGASVSADKNVCLITIKDNDANFYEKIAGEYAHPELGPTKILAYNEDNPKYNQELVIAFDFGLIAQASLKYSFDMANKKVNLSMPLGQRMLKGVSMDGIPVPFDLMLGLADANDNFITDGEATLNISDDFKTISLKEDKGVFAIGMVFEGTNKLIGYFYAGPNFVLKRN